MYNKNEKKKERKKERMENTYADFTYFSSMVVTGNKYFFLILGL